jgi:hypothetical protein
MGLPFDHFLPVFSHILPWKLCTSMKVNGVPYMPNLALRSLNRLQVSAQSGPRNQNPL